MSARIGAVATAVPEYAVTQERAREFARGFFAEDLPEIDRLLRAFGNTGIKRRHIARPPEWYERPHGFPEKNEVYRETALELSTRAAKRALDRSGVSPSEIGAIVFVSTTGVSTPSLDSVLVQRLGLPLSVARLPIWGLGCAGGAAGLARSAVLTAGMGRPTLMISAEVCSTTFLHGDRSKSNLIATALFGDGAAAVVLTPDGDGAEVVCGHSHLLEDSQDVMGWKLEEEGLRVVFARSIPQIVHDVAGQVARDAAREAGIEMEDLVHYVFHPGGAKVLQAYVDTLGIDHERLRLARDVLADYGNMSSPTVLFVLERLLAETAPAGAPGLLLALGPGFSAESVVFRW